MQGEEPTSSVTRAAFAMSTAGIAALVISGAWVNIYAPLPSWVPGRATLTMVYGVVLLGAAVALAWRRTLATSSAAVALLFLAWLLVLQVPYLVRRPGAEGLWLGVSQLVALVVAPWILFARSAFPAGRAARLLAGDRAVHVARMAYGLLALPMFGLHHFLAPGAPQAVPAWLPMRAGWAYATGVAQIAAGTAILVGFVPRLAATLEAVLIAVFILLVHVPGVLDAPTDHLQWSMLVVASALGGAAWIVARSYAGQPWLRPSAPRRPGTAAFY